MGRGERRVAPADRRTERQRERHRRRRVSHRKPGFSVFVLDDGVVYHTYSTGWRGLEFLMGYYPILDRTPKGRDEDNGFQLWLRRHDEYARG